MEHLPYLVTFARVVQSGSFVAGAERLSLSPSVASKHISKLEKKLGARLLNRSTRKLSLTEAGTAYYEHAARILEELDQSEHAVQRLQAEPSGRLKVSVLNSFCDAVLSAWMPEYLQRYPKVQPELMCSERMVDLTEEGYDLALRVTRTPPPNVVARKLAQVQFQVCASPAYLERHGSPSSPDELIRHRCLGYPATLTPDGAWRFVHQGREIVAPIRSVCEVSSVATLRRLALAGEGLALLPTYSMGDELRSGQLCLPMPQFRGFTETILYAVYLPNRFGSPKLRSFVDFLVEKIGDVPPWDLPLANT